MYRNCIIFQPLKLLTSGVILYHFLPVLYRNLLPPGTTLFSKVSYVIQLSLEKKNQKICRYRDRGYIMEMVQVIIEVNKLTIWSLWKQAGQQVLDFKFKVCLLQFYHMYSHCNPVKLNKILNITLSSCMCSRPLLLFTSMLCCISYH